MRKHNNRVPPALRHGIYSGIGLLPTENPARLRKFKKQMFAELNLVGRLEEDIGNDIVRLEWRRQNLSTYELAQRAQARRNSIYSEQIPTVRYLYEELERTPHPDNPTPEEFEASHKRANKQVRTELGAAIELLEIGDVATLGYLERRLGILERLDGMITRAYKKLLYVRGIKSMSGPSPAGSPQPLLGEAA
ncbi:MAG TPA: hypothetical protein VEK34_11805 [Methylocella sp.]|nr:hypothetical protein [Methylocella sp.]